MSTRPKASSVDATTPALVRFEQVSGHGQGARQVLDQGLEPILAAGRHHDRGAGGVQDAGEPVAQPARGAGDDGDAPVEAEQGERVEVGRHGPPA
jgi:hypothetical protein